MSFYDTYSSRLPVSITPNDSVTFSECRAINVAVPGTVTVDTAEASNVQLYIAAGIAFPVCATRVYATGTSATGIVALY